MARRENNRRVSNDEQYLRRSVGDGAGVLGRIPAGNSPAASVNARGESRRIAGFFQRTRHVERCGHRASVAGEWEAQHYGRLKIN